MTKLTKGLQLTVAFELHQQSIISEPESEEQTFAISFDLILDKEIILTLN